MSSKVWKVISLVDGGKTTLFSPIYNLSEYEGAIVSYWKWYTNNQGNNPGSDFWQVSISNDAGNSWSQLEYTNDSNNYWKLEQFFINDYVNLTDQIQFKFIAEDIYNNGDNGTGGSLVEAAIDDFSIQVLLSEEECPIGDLNQDGVFNVLDVVVMVTLILGPIDEWDLYLCLAEMNGDGQLNVQDIIILVNLILN